MEGCGQVVSSLQNGFSLLRVATQRLSHRRGQSDREREQSVTTSSTKGTGFLVPFPASGKGPSIESIFIGVMPCKTLHDGAVSCLRGPSERVQRQTLLQSGV